MTLPLVLMPGLDGTGKLFEAILTQPGLQDAVVIRYSSAAESVDACVDEAVMQLPKEPFVLVAESFSGAVALKLPMSIIENVKGIVFVATFAECPRKVLLPLAQLFPINWLIALGSNALLARAFCLGFKVSPTAVRHFQLTLQQVAPKTLAQRLRSLAEFNATEKLTLFAGKPALYLRATEDKLVPQKTSEVFAKHGIEVRDIQAPHFVLQVEPETSSQYIREISSSTET